MASSLPFDETVNMLKAVAEPTRLRLALLLLQGDLTVSDLVKILGQSQPRISRHLKLMVDAGVVSRYQEGAWAYFRLSGDDSAELVRRMLPLVGAADGPPAQDRDRLAIVRARRAERAAAYFADNAAEWDRIRALHVPDALMEAALLEVLGDDPVDRFLDIGTGTGRMLELIGPRARQAVGVDASREMLAIARAKLDGAALSHVSVRLGDAYDLPVEPLSHDLIVLHHVLHFLDEPAAAMQEAAKALRPGGRLVVVDFDAHDCEFLREDHAHARLGFSQTMLAGYFEAAGLEATGVRALHPGERGQLTVLISTACKPARTNLVDAALPARFA